MTISLNNPSITEGNITEAGKSAAGVVTGTWTKLILAVIILACSMTVFLIAPKHAPLFPTNGSPIFAGSVCGVFLLAAVLFKRSEKLAKFSPLAYAFFIASGYNLVADLFGAYEQDILRWFGVEPGTDPALGIGKTYEMLLAVIPFIALTLLSGAKLRSIYLTRGNFNYKWGLGIGALFLVNYLTSVLMFNGGGYSVPALGSAILWGLVFSFGNSILEELWVRGLFMKKLLPLVGVVGTVIVTSAWFALMHLLGVIYLPAYAIPVYVVNTFTMGIACAILMLKTESIWGAFGLHAAADLFLYIALLSPR